MSIYRGNKDIFGVYRYMLSSFIFDLAMVGLIPILGFYLTYFAFSRGLDPVIQYGTVIFNLILFLPIVFIFVKAKHKIIITSDGITQKMFFCSRFIAWEDIKFIKYNTLVSSFSQPRFSKPQDLVILSKKNVRIYIMEALDGFYVLKDFFEHEYSDRFI